MVDKNGNVLYEGDRVIFRNTVYYIDRFLHEKIRIHKWSSYSKEIISVDPEKVSLIVENKDKLPFRRFGVTTIDSITDNTGCKFEECARSIFFATNEDDLDEAMYNLQDILYNDVSPKQVNTDALEDYLHAAYQENNLHELKRAVCIVQLYNNPKAVVPMLETFFQE